MASNSDVNVSVNARPVPAGACQICRKKNKKGYVRCAECKLWFHFECVGVTLNALKEVDNIWICSSCTPADNDRATSPLTSKEVPNAPSNFRERLDDQPDESEEDEPQDQSSRAEPQDESLSDFQRLVNTMNSLHTTMKTLHEDGKAHALEVNARMSQRLDDSIAVVKQSVLAAQNDFDTNIGDVKNSLKNVQKVFDNKLEKLEERINFRLSQQQLNLNQFTRQSFVSDAKTVPRSSTPPLVKKPTVAASTPIVEPREKRVTFNISESQLFTTARDFSPGASHSTENDVSEEVSSPIIPTPSTSQSGSDMGMLVHIMRKQNLSKLPDFDGAPLDWAFFENLYNSTTKEGSLTESDNLDRLRGCIKGAAREHVKQLLMFTNSATEIMNRLRKEFGDPEVIIVKQQHKLTGLPALTKSNDPKLSNFCNKVADFVATVKCLNRHADLENIYILNALEEKLASSPLYAPWARIKKQAKIDSKKITLDDFSKFLEERRECLPRDLIIASAANTNEKPKATPLKQPVKKSVLTHQVKVNSVPACPCCGEAHILFKCPSFKSRSISERWNLVKEKRLCSACLRSNHIIKDCSSKQECGIAGCKRHHARLLHSEPKNSNNTTPKNSELDPNTPPFNATNSTNSNLHHASCHHNDHDGNDAVSNQVLFKVVPVRLHGRHKSISTYALLDDASSLSLVDKSLFEELGCKGVEKDLCLQWTKGILRKEKSMMFNLVVSAERNRKKYTLKDVFTVEDIDLPEQSMNVAEMQKRFSHLRGLPLVPLSKAKPRILIGLEHSRFTAGSRTVFGGPDDPIASKTPLAWTVYGKTTQPMVKSIGSQGGTRLMFHSTPQSKDEALHQLVKDHFTTENFGVSPSSTPLTSKDDQRALGIFTNSLKMVDGHYEIDLPWKDDNIKLPDSYQMCFKRLLSEEKKLSQAPDQLEWKNNHIKSLLAKGYIREATSEDLNSSWPRVWYTPTFVTVNKNKIPPKPREVCDVAAQVNGISLNSTLLKGPDLMAPLIAGLFRFREGAIAATGDVREMFNQVRISKRDQQCQRFLWRDGDKSREPTIYVYQVMMFGPTCSPSISQFIKNFHASKYDKQFPEAAEALIKSTYVDDYLNSHNDVEEALRVTNNAIEICSTMGFELVGFQSNSHDLMSKLPQSNLKDKLVSLDASDFESYMSKVLGMFWRASQDVFTYVVFESDEMQKLTSPEYHPTKREVLSTIMKVFDPLGFLAPFTIHGKAILQEIWRYGSAWDDPIPEDLLKRWNHFLSEFKNVKDIQIPRHYSPGLPAGTKVSLIVFVDASEEAFAASAYFRFVSEQNVVKIAQVMAKAKVAPIKQLSIPQLELQAAVMGVRLAKSIKDLHSFKIESTKFLSDSRCVLAWVCSKTYKFKSFVAVRVGEILEASSQNEWFHIGTKQNVADDATRTSEIKLTSDSRWFTGPEFLKDDEESWPIKRATDFALTNSVNIHRLMIHVDSPNSTLLPSFETLGEIKAHFKASWGSLVRVTAFICRFRKILASKVSSRRPGASLTTYSTSKFITPEEFQEAENVIFRKIQCDAFPAELKELMSPNATSVKPSSKILSLNPFLHSDGVLRMSSRAQSAKISYAAKNPAILPNNHEFVDLYLQHHHVKNAHMAVETTIADARQRAWIVNIRSAVNRVRSNCQRCKIARAKPLVPLMGELPEARLDFGVRAFTYVGIDCFGPILVKQARSEVKRYGIIFTCLTYRAVHLELLKDLTTTQVMMAIRALVTIRGKSREFFSDNGSNLVGCNNQLNRDVGESASILGEETAKRFSIKCNFIPAYCPWAGGSWERLIQSVKKSLDFTLNGETVTEDVLRAALIEAQFQINRRPLTHAPIDHEDAKPLTPNAVLFGDDDDEALPPGEFGSADRYSSQAHRRAQHLAMKFQHRWISEYLPEITRRSKWYKNTKPIELGDVAIIVEPNEVRNNWKRGRVIAVNPGPDGIVRSVDVLLADGTTKLKRAVGRLAILDVKSTPRQNSA